VNFVISIHAVAHASLPPNRFISLHFADRYQRRAAVHRNERLHHRCSEGRLEAVKRRGLLHLQESRIEVTNEEGIAWDERKLTAEDPMDSLQGTPSFQNGEGSHAYPNQL
jgi:hypothetical protein